MKIEVNQDKTTQKDPVCNMTVSEEYEHQTHFAGKKYFFAANIAFRSLKKILSGMRKKRLRHQPDMIMKPAIIPVPCILKFNIADLAVVPNVACRWSR